MLNQWLNISWKGLPRK